MGMSTNTNPIQLCKYNVLMTLALITDVGPTLLLEVPHFTDIPGHTPMSNIFITGPGLSKTDITIKLHSPLNI